MKQLLNLTKELELHKHSGQPGPGQIASLPLPPLHAPNLINPIISGLQQTMNQNQSDFCDNPEFLKIVENYNNILSLLLQTLNDVIENTNNS